MTQRIWIRAGYRCGYEPRIQRIRGYDPYRDIEARIRSHGIEPSEGFISPPWSRRIASYPSQNTAMGGRPEQQRSTSASGQNRKAQVPQSDGQPEFLPAKSMRTHQFSEKCGGFCVKNMSCRALQNFMDSVRNAQERGTT